MARYCPRESNAYRLLVGNLSANQCKAYWFVAGNHAAFASDLAAGEGWKINYASTVLKELYDLGILVREGRDYAEEGKGFLYRLKRPV